MEKYRLELREMSSNGRVRTGRQVIEEQSGSEIQTRSEEDFSQGAGGTVKAVPINISIPHRSSPGRGDKKCSPGKGGDSDYKQQAPQSKINNNSIIQIFMWPNLSNFCYDPFLLSFYQSPLCLPFPYPSLQSYAPIPTCAQTEESPIMPEKSYRETVQEIEQKQAQKTTHGRKKRIEKSRVIIKKEKEDNFERKKQKKDRNLPSNICKYFVSYLYHHPHPQTIIKTTQDAPLQTQLKICIQQLKKHVKSTQTYIRPGLIEALCRTDLLTPHSAKLLRILFRRFIGTEFRMMISMIRKLTKKEKVAYFKLGRKFVKKFTAEE